MCGLDGGAGPSLLDFCPKWRRRKLGNTNGDLQPEEPGAAPGQSCAPFSHFQHHGVILPRTVQTAAEYPPKVDAQKLQPQSGLRIRFFFTATPPTFNYIPSRDLTQKSQADKLP